MNAILASLLLSLMGANDRPLVKVPQIGLTFRVPDHCVRNTEIERSSPKVICAFLEPNPRGGIFRRLLVFEKLGGTIDREKLDPKYLQDFRDVKLSTVMWGDFELEAVRFVESAGESQIVTFNVQVPLKKQAVQLRFAGPLADESEIRLQLMEILSEVEGESNWSQDVTASRAPLTKTIGSPSGDNFGYYLLAGGVIFIIGGLISLWLISRKAPRGVVLVIAVVIWVASWQPAHDRAIKMVTGSMRMLGFAGGILGIVDLLRKRPVSVVVPNARQPTVPPPEPKPNSHLP